MSQIPCTCGKKIATIHVTEIVNGEKKELHLCEECAKKKKIFFPAATSVLDLSDVLSGIIDAAGHKGADELNKMQCPQCGMTFADFRSGGRFGCPNDYEAFRKGVDPLLERIHGTTQHRGKAPAKGPAKAPQAPASDRLAELRAELKKAVADEAYERAARLRDQIYALKKDQGDATD